MTHRIPSAMPSKLIEPLGEASSTGSAGAGLSDIEHSSALDPSLVKSRRLDGRVLCLEPPGGADI
jgi:hypothetical protein